MSDLFPDVPPPSEDLPWTLDCAVATFLNRWIPRCLSAEIRGPAESELRALIADAKEHSQ